MEIPRDIDALTKLFEKFGASNAEAWATSQIKEGIPQLQRFLFLRQAWKCIVSDTNTTWIDREVKAAERSPSGPYANVGAVLKRALAAGVSAQELTDMVRGLQASFLFQLCYLLDDPGFSEQELETFSWGLFEIDENGNPNTPRIGGLHESVLETDPSGREMRPRGSTNA